MRAFKIHGICLLVRANEELIKKEKQNKIDTDERIVVEVKGILKFGLVVSVVLAKSNQIESRIE